MRQCGSTPVSSAANLHRRLARAAFGADGLGPGDYGAAIGLNGVLIVVLQPLVLGVLSRRRRGPLLLVAMLLQGVGFGLTALAVLVRLRAYVTGSRYDDVELVCLTGGNPDAARILVARELGALVADDPALAKVRETVSRYLQLGCNVEAAAIELVVHKNTVRYRLGQAEELIGHPLTERRTEIDLALRLLAHQPSA